MDTTDLARFLEARNLAAELIRLAVPTTTVEEAAQAMHTAPDQIVKSLLFLVDGNPVLVIACGLTRVDARKIAAHFGLSRKRVRLAGPEEVLATTGFAIGGLPPFGHRQPLQTLVDRKVAAQTEVYAGGGSGETLLRVSPSDILRHSSSTVLDLSPADEAAG